MSDFRIAPPNTLKLPEALADQEVKYFDDSQPVGYRCPWLLTWLTFRDEETANRTRPHDWRWGNTGGMPDPEHLPDSYLRASMGELSAWGVWFSPKAFVLFQTSASKYDGDWRYDCCRLIEASRLVEKEAISPYNPPAETANRLKFAGMWSE